MLAGLALVSCALDHVKEMLDHADGREGVAVVVEVEPPRVAGAFREDFEHVCRRVKPPDPGVEALTLGGGCARPAYVGVREHAVRAIEPSVGPPCECVEHFVRVVVSPAVEHHLRRPGGAILSLDDGDEQQIRRRADPDAAEPHLNRAEEIEVFHEDLPPVELSVAVGVFEDENPVSPLAFGCAHGIRMRFSDPQPAAVVVGKGDWPHDLGLRRRQRHREAFGHAHGGGCRLGRQAGVPDRIHRRQGGDLGGRDFVHEDGLRLVETKISKLRWAHGLSLI